VSVRIFTGVLRFGRHEIAFRDKSRLTETIGPRQRRMRVVDSTIDNADDNTGSVTQQPP
jgi:hypothetical protein